MLAVFLVCVCVRVCVFCYFLHGNFTKTATNVSQYQNKENTNLQQ